jgi:hypothetical protein
MPKVTYIIGAGASAQALPLVKPIKDGRKTIDGFPEALVKVGKDILQSTESESRTVKKIHDQFLSLADKCEEFDTIDTYAKYCYLTDQARLKTVKELLALFFILEQKFYNKSDKRYLVFLTTLLEYKKEFPKEIKILSWNYDSQFQIAWDMFGREISPLFYYPNINNANYQPNDYHLIYLNGIADYKKKIGKLIAKPINDLKSFIEFYEKEISENESLLTFAWESAKSQFLSNSLELAKNNIYNTDYLVIIGYSFPFFNRGVDSEIFSAILKSDSLKKIYYQDKFRSGNFIRAQFNIPDNIDIETINKVDQFYVPFEL